MTGIQWPAPFFMRIRSFICVGNVARCYLFLEVPCGIARGCLCAGSVREGKRGIVVMVTDTPGMSGRV